MSTPVIWGEGFEDLRMLDAEKEWPRMNLM